MAKITQSKTLFAFTSPRSIEKIIPEIRLLTDTLSGEKWSSESQSEFYETLFDSEIFDGGNKAKDTALAARDRITRAPKALGFVDLKPVIQLTPAGKVLLRERRTHEIITKQLLKFQLPSPYMITSKRLYTHRKVVLGFLNYVKLTILSC